MRLGRNAAAPEQTGSDPLSVACVLGGRLKACGTRATAARLTSRITSTVVVWLHKTDLVGVPSEKGCGIGRRDARVKILGQLSCLQRGTHLPAQARRSVATHLMHRPGGHIKALASGVSPLNAVTNHAHRTLQDLEVLVLARMQVRRREGAAASEPRLHLKEILSDRHKAQPTSVLALKFVPLARHVGTLSPVARDGQAEILATWATMDLLPRDSSACLGRPEDVAPRRIQPPTRHHVLPHSAA